MLLIRALLKGTGPYAIVAAIISAVIAGGGHLLLLGGREGAAAGIVITVVAAPFVILFFISLAVNGLAGFFGEYLNQRAMFRQMDAAARRKIRIQTALLWVVGAGGILAASWVDQIRIDRENREHAAAVRIEEEKEAKRKQDRLTFFGGPEGCTKKGSDNRKLPLSLLSKEERDEYDNIITGTMRGVSSGSGGQGRLRDLVDRIWTKSCDGATAKVDVAPPVVPDQIKRCGGCHIYKAEADNSHLWQRRSGPTLIGVVGRMAGAKTGEFHTKALTQSGIVWTEKSLIAYIVDPKSVIPHPEKAILGHTSGAISEGDAKVIVDYLEKLR